MSPAKRAAAGRQSRQTNGALGSGGYGAHPAAQEHGTAAAEHKQEGLLSKTVGLIKGALKMDSQPQEKKLQRQMAKKWQSSDVAEELKAVDGSSQGSQPPASAKRYRARGPARVGGSGVTADVKQPSTPERPPTVALSGMTLSGRPAKGSKQRGSKRTARDAALAPAGSSAVAADGRITRSKSRRLAMS